MEVVEDVLFAAEHAVAMPLLAFFTASAEIGDCPDATGFDPRQDRCGVAGGERDAEAAVAVEHRGPWSIGPLGRGQDEHPYVGAVLRGVRHLSGVHAWDVDDTGRLGVERELLRASIEGVDDGHRGVVGVDQPHDRAAVGPLHGSADRARAGQGDRADERAGVEVVHAELADDMSGATHQQKRTHHLGAIEDRVAVEDGVGLLRQQFAPGLVPHVLGRAREEASARCVAVRRDVEEAVAPDVQARLGVDIALHEPEGGRLGR